MRKLGNYPVVNVTVEAATAYLDWAGQRLGRALRLPYESEWLLGAQAGRDGYWHVEDARAGLVNYRETLAEPTEVGEFHANPYGVFDLLGQVWEICRAGTGEPVLRGGAFNTPVTRLLERWAPPVECRSDVGFRCASDGDGR
jgi:formylglycine-generating enzyme required for sulfatase activity